MACNDDIDDSPRLHCGLDLHRYELLGMTALAGFHEARGGSGRLPGRDDGARPPPPLARSACARRFTVSRGTWGMRAAGVPGRGENGNT